MSTPTPRPTPDLTAMITDLWYAGRDLLAVLTHRDPADEVERQAVQRFHAALDRAARREPDASARDARVRAETLRAAYAKVEELIGAYPLPIACAAGIDGEFHTWAFDQFDREGLGKGFPSSVGRPAVPTEGSGRRCPSGIAHESGAVLNCMHRAGHRGTHWTQAAQWWDSDDRLITKPAEGSGHPQPATARCAIPNCPDPDHREGADRG